MYRTLTGVILDSPVRQQAAGGDVVHCRLGGAQAYPLRLAGPLLTAGEALATGSEVRVSGRLRKGRHGDGWFLDVEALEVLQRPPEARVPRPSEPSSRGDERPRPTYKGFRSHGGRPR